MELCFNKKEIEKRKNKREIGSENPLCFRLVVLISLIYFFDGKNILS